MTVGFDEQVFLAQRRGGISRYFVNLIEQLRAGRELGLNPVVGWRFAPNEHAAEAGLSRIPSALDRVPAAERAVCYLANTPARRRAQATEVLHHSYYHPRFLAANVKARHVTTIHDMIPELFPDSFSGPNPHLAKHAYVENSDLIVCVSQSARDDLIAVYGTPAAPVRIIHHGVGPGFSPDLPPPTGTPSRYLLYVGRRDGYKDFDVLLRAVAGLDDDIALVAVGGGPFSDAERTMHARLGLGARLLRREASDVELRRLYAHATVFVFPSRHEGFGLPTLEAMASGTAVVLADTSSHPEVGGDVARYFPAGDDESLRDVLTALLGDGAERSALGLSGISHAAAFTWRASAEAHAQAYLSLLGPDQKG